MAPKASNKSKRGTDAAAPSSPPKKAKTGLAVGDVLPDFEVETDECKTIASKDLVADTGAIIFFYPRANTGGCTTQACGFRDNHDDLVSAGYKVYGMSADKPKSQASWKAKHNFQYSLLCDPSFEALKKLGVAKGDKGIKRSHIVIGKGGTIEQVHYDISPKESVAEAVKLIGSSKEAEEKADEAESEGEAAGPEEPAEEAAAAGKEEESEEEAEVVVAPVAKKGKAKAAVKPAPAKEESEEEEEVEAPVAKKGKAKAAAKPAPAKAAAKPVSSKAAAKSSAKPASGKAAAAKPASGKAANGKGKAKAK